MPDEIKPRNQVLVVVEMAITVGSQLPASPEQPMLGKQIGVLAIQGGGAIPPDTWENATAKMERSRCAHELLMRVVGELPQAVIEKLAELCQGAYAGEGEPRIVQATAADIGRMR